MNIRNPLRAIACAVALTIAAGVSAASASSDTMDIEIRTAAGTEKLSLVDLAPGETRQVYSEAGTLVTATRTADLLVLDIGGDKTEIRMFDAQGLGADGHHVWVDKDVEGDSDGRHVVRIHAGHSDGVAVFHGDDAAHAERKIVVMRNHDAGDADAIEAEVIDLLGDGAVSGDGKQVIVKRHVSIDTQSDD